jgi:hypothetical protein
METKGVGQENTEKCLRSGQGPKWAVGPLVVAAVVVMEWRNLITKNSAENISQIIGLKPMRYSWSNNNIVLSTWDGHICVVVCCFLVICDLLNDHFSTEYITYRRTVTWLWIMNSEIRGNKLCGLFWGRGRQTSDRELNPETPDYQVLG